MRNRHVADTSTLQRTISPPQTIFEPAIPKNERTQTHALDRAATDTKTTSCTDVGHYVAQLVEALSYKPEGRRFDSRWCHWNFSLT